MRACITLNISILGQAMDDTKLIMNCTRLSYEKLNEFRRLHGLL